MSWISVPYSVRKLYFCYHSCCLCRYTSLCANPFKVLYVLTAVIVVPAYVCVLPVLVCGALCFGFLQAKCCSFIICSVHVMLSTHFILSDLIIHAILDDEDIVNCLSCHLPCSSVALSVLNPCIFLTIV